MPSTPTAPTSARRTLRPLDYIIQVEWSLIPISLINTSCRTESSPLLSQLDSGGVCLQLLSGNNRYIPAILWVGTGVRDVVG